MLVALGPLSAQAAITEIIDQNGSPGLDSLNIGASIAVDGAGNVYVGGAASDNVFKIATPGTCSTGGTPCTITEIIDATGDAGVNTLNNSRAIAVDGAGNVYVVGASSSNAFKIDGPTPAEPIPALSLRGSLIALLLLFLGTAVARLSRQRARRSGPGIARERGQTPFHFGKALHATAGAWQGVTVGSTARLRAGSWRSAP